MSRLLREILERVEYERLIEEGRDPSEVLHYKFQHIPSEIIDSVIEIDPTKKKSYSQWLLSKWDDEKDTIINNLENGRIAKLFQHYKEHNDIQIKDCPSVKEGLEAFVPQEDTVLTKSKKPMTTLMNRGWTEEVPSELANDFDIVFNEDDWIIAVPNTYEADCKLGENMNWCTAGGRSSFENGRAYYNRYLKEGGGKYYVNFDMSKGESRLGKDYPFTRYQFHFESNQFMDKEDEPVVLSEIEMPDSAKEFYSNEGYDTDKFESLEARMERYEERRWQCSYRINNELYLNIQYDDEYEFTEPNENTDFYLFSEDDDRDPISWDEIPNPHTTEGVIILNNDWCCILKKKYGKEDNEVLAAINKNNSGWGRWETFVFKKYLMLPENIGLFGVNNEHNFVFASTCGDIDFNRLEVSQCENIFINEACTKADADNWGMIFVEAVADGYHSLFAVSPNIGTGDECEMIVMRDKPINGNYFVINEKGLIDGEFRSYRVYDDEYYGGEASEAQYDLEEQLSTSDYLISMETHDYVGAKSRVLYNILRKGSNQPLIEQWFDKYIAHSKNLYGVLKGEKVGFFNITNGQQVGEWYDDYGGIDQEKDILFGKVGQENNPTKVDILNGLQGNVSATFKDIISRKSINNKIIVIDKDGTTRKVFDYVEGRFYFPELGEFMRVSQYEHPFLFACNIGETEEKALFDLKSQKILIRGIKSFSKPNRYSTNYIKLNKLNGKCNMFDTNNQVELINGDADEITSMNEYTFILVYAVNGKYYPLNYKTNNIMINPNGIGLPTYVNDSDKIYCSSDNYNMYFVPYNGLNEYEFYSWQNKTVYNDYGTNFDPQSTPQEVLNMYNLIFRQQEAITKNFKNYMKRINEAMKYRYNDLID